MDTIGRLAVSLPSSAVRVCRGTNTVRMVVGTMFLRRARATAEDEDGRNCGDDEVDGMLHGAKFIPIRVAYA